QQVIPARLKTAVDLAAAGKHHLVMGMNIPEELSRIGEEAFKQAPAGLAPFRGLLKTRSGYMTLHYDPQAEKDFRLFTQLQYDTADAARVGQGGIKFALAMAKLAMTSAPNYDATMKEITELGNKMLNNIQTELVDKEVRITFEASISQYMPMMAAALAKVRRAADQLLSASNMRQLMIAMHNYHNDYNRMPPPVLMKNDQPLHSWRVLVLPYVEEDNLFKQIKLDEPWNSPHNLKIFESTPMPKIFRHPTIREESHKKTYYKVFTSMPGKKPAAGFTLGSNITLGQLTVQDGTSNTLAMIESGPPVLWYQPEDIVFDPEGAFPKLQSPWPDNRVNASFFDASTRSLRLGQHEDIWRALITRNGGEMPDSSKLEEREAK
ncbi:MAG TPA: DUF1559 domain-containing protein, partial [Gemmatales bacterium]|nr:DUF1559 domain-containing protein [Gemmatales bacterium]